MVYLFYFTIGPVQSFISQSRKTQDIYAGSQLLSNVITAAAKLFGQKIIYPHIAINGPTASAPNRFCGVKSVADPMALGKKLEADVREYFANVLLVGVMEMDGKQVYSQADLYAIKGFKEQLAEHLEVYWGFEPLASEQDYPKAHQRLLKKMLGVKALRVFEQYNYPTSAGELGRKCSLDGERNVKFYRLNAQEYTLKDKLPQKLFSKADEVEILDYPTVSPPPTLRHLQPGEGLSAVSFAKRCWGNNAYYFPSTAEVALCGVAHQHKRGFSDFAKAVKSNLGIELEDSWQLFYEENLNANYLKKNIGVAESERWNENGENVLNAHRDLTNTLKNDQKALSKYYAVVSFDGDDMGRWWQGEFLPEGQKSNLLAFQEALAESLNKFAVWANNELFKPEEGVEISGGGDDLTIVFRGKTVYAGGDDYLGFVNLDFVWEMLDQLQSKFSEYTNAVLETYEITRPLTFSAGVSIAHYKEPLQRVLADAQGVQKSAKTADETKNKLGISVLKHSGEQHECILDKNAATDMKDLVRQLQTDFSDTFIKKIQAKYSLLLTKNGQLADESLKDYFLKELETWHWDARKHNEVDKANFAALKNLLEKSRIENVQNLRNFINALYIADFTAIKTNL